MKIKKKYIYIYWWAWSFALCLVITREMILHYGETLLGFKLHFPVLISLGSFNVYLLLIQDFIVLQRSGVPNKDSHDAF